MSAEISAFSGPLPPPDVLAKYEHEVYQGCAREIVGMANAQMHHRHTLETAKLQGDLGAEKRGMYCAAAIAIIAIICGTYLVATGRSTSGLVTILGTVGSLVAVFLSGRVLQNRERRKKLKMLEEIAAGQKPIAKFE